MMHSLHAKYYDVDYDDDYDVEYGLHRNMISSLTFVWRDETIEKCAQSGSDRNICAHSSLIIQTIPEDRFEEEDEKNCNARLVASMLIASAIFETNRTKRGNKELVATAV